MAPRRPFNPASLPGSVLFALSLALSCTTTGGGSSGSGPGKRPGKDQTDEARGSPTPVAIAAGTGHSCVLRESGAVACWGANNRGQLGDGTTEDRSSPVTVKGLGDAVELALGRSHSCARRKSGAVVCWGSNERGQLGDSTGGPGKSRGTPIAVRGLSDAIAIASGDDHTCALRESAAVVCWGANADGQLGNKTRNSWTEPAQIRGLADATSLAAGARHTCALRQGGGVICWGANDKGQLGDGTTKGHERPTAVAELPPLEGLAAAGSRTCGFTRQGVYCWGAQPPSEGGSLEPRVVAEGSPNDAIAELALGPGHGCLRHASGTARCWGLNRDGRLGDGSFEPRSRPVPLGALGGVSDLALGARHSCALRSTGQVFCWGDDAGGALGQGEPDQGEGAAAERSGVRRVINLTDAVDLASGHHFSCAVRQGGAVTCWGLNDKGQLGDASKDDSRASPGPVATIDDAVAIGAGPAQACAVRGSGAVLCWGENDKGQLGRSPGPALRHPSPVPKLQDAIAVSIGDSHACALRRSGEVLCWGSDEEGQLGDGAGSRGGKVAQLADAVELSSGRAHTCARRRSGAISCWGANNQGQIGNSAGAAQLKQPLHYPAGVTKVGDAISIAAGPEHGCAITRNGKAVCWGRNDLGQLGSGTSSHVWTSRVPVRDLRGASTIDIGPVHACAAGSGRVSCWGDNSAGQGGFAGESATTPRPGVSGLEVATLALGRDHSCARLQSGEVACWGSNEHGQLGDGGRPISATPLEVAEL